MNTQNSFSEYLKKNGLNYQSFMYIDSDDNARIDIIPLDNLEHFSKSLKFYIIIRKVNTNHMPIWYNYLNKKLNGHYDTMKLEDDLSLSKDDYIYDLINYYHKFGEYKDESIRLRVYSL